MSVYAINIAQCAIWRNDEISSLKVTHATKILTAMHALPGDPLRKGRRRGTPDSPSCRRTQTPDYLRAAHGGTRRDTAGPDLGIMSERPRGSPFCTGSRIQTSGKIPGAAHGCCAGSTRAQTWETSQRPRGSPPTTGFYVFSFTAGLLARRHPLFPVSKKGPVGPMEALGELPHHVKVVPHSGERRSFSPYPIELNFFNKLFL